MGAFRVTDVPTWLALAKIDELDRELVVVYVPASSAGDCPWTGRMRPLIASYLENGRFNGVGATRSFK